jgi:beta-glucosidase
MKNHAVKAIIFSGALICSGIASAATVAPVQPWMNTALSADERASLVIKQMTQTEMLSMVFGYMGIPNRPGGFGNFMAGKHFTDVIGSAGYIPGIPRLGIPALQESDASLGVANMGGMIRPGDVATALPSSLALGASFDPMIANQGGAMIGGEAWHKGFNVLLGPGVNLIRDPRNGRNFEYVSEDPLLTGTLGAQFIRGIQSQNVSAVAKHYAFNDQETNRSYVNPVSVEAAMRESDLMAFELAIEGGKPGSIMCSYNLINGAYACSNNHLLNDVLKDDWHYSGWVMSDWGAVHDIDSVNAGLDQESAALLDNGGHFGPELVKALADGKISAARLTDMTQRILRSMFAAGLIDHPPVKAAIDYNADGAVALHEEQEGIVLLKNENHLLPLTQQVMHIAIIGGHAEAGVLSGGGSSQVYPVGGSAATIPVAGSNPVLAALHAMTFDPSAPLAAIHALAPKAEIRFDTGEYPSAAAHLAKWADVVIVFGTKWQTEGEDVPDLSLPSGQDALISAVAAANPKTIVVLETGSAVAMPWLDNVGAVMEAWFPGQKGGDAIASVLYGTVNPSGHLPITFPRDMSQNPRPVMPGIDVAEPQQGLAPATAKGNIFDVNYNIEGSSVGYRWFTQKNLTPLFPFGFGLSYTDFAYSNLTVEGGKQLTVSFDVTNTGTIAGAAVPQVYMTSRAGQPLERLIGFSRVSLNPGQKLHISVSADPRLLADFDPAGHVWRIPGGNYNVMVGSSAMNDALNGSAMLDAATMHP